MDQEPSSEADLVFPEPSRRRKRRGGLYALIAVTLLLAFSFGFSNLRSDRADLREFVDLTKVTSLEHEALAAQFRDFLNFELASADRDRISALFGRIETSIRQSLDELDALSVPASGAGSAALFEESLRAWLGGSVALENSLLVAADEPTSPIPIIAIDDALIDVQVGDRLYERFLLSLGELRTELETDIGVLPLVAYAPAGGLPVTGELLAAAVRGSNQVAAFHDVRVGQIGLDPDFTGGQHDGVGVLAFTETVNATAVVSNAGNLPESDLTVALRVITVADGTVVFSEQTIITSLEPGASRTVEFLDVPVVEGITHEVLAIVMAVTGDVDGDNNTASLSFFVQAPS
ncbi:MAG: hypothetical protein P1T08_09455 [Acidimicrobiia bacterium]|nr:hypothetical protein [Acidimicrobiia bacterium]